MIFSGKVYMDSIENASIQTPPPTNANAVRDILNGRNLDITAALEAEFGAFSEAPTTPTTNAPPYSNAEDRFYSTLLNSFPKDLQRERQQATEIIPPDVKREAVIKRSVPKVNPLANLSKAKKQELITNAPQQANAPDFLSMDWFLGVGNH